MTGRSRRRKRPSVVSPGFGKSSTAELPCRDKRSSCDGTRNTHIDVKFLIRYGGGNAFQFAALDVGWSGNTPVSADFACPAYLHTRRRMALRSSWRRREMETSARQRSTGSRAKGFRGK